MEKLFQKNKVGILPLPQQQSTTTPGNSVAAINLKRLLSKIGLLFKQSKFVTLDMITQLKLEQYLKDGFALVSTLEKNLKISSKNSNNPTFESEIIRFYVEELEALQREYVKLRRNSLDTKTDATINNSNLNVILEKNSQKNTEKLQQISTSKPEEETKEIMIEEKIEKSTKTESLQQYLKKLLFSDEKTSNIENAKNENIPTSTQKPLEKPHSYHSRRITQQIELLFNNQSLLNDENQIIEKNEKQTTADSDSDALLRQEQDKLTSEMYLMANKLKQMAVDMGNTLSKDNASADSMMAVIGHNLSAVSSGNKSIRELNESTALGLWTKIQMLIIVTVMSLVLFLIIRLFPKVRI